MTPLSALALAELAHRAGVPAGVLNVLTGAPATVGSVLAEHPTVRKLSFTGSTPTARTPPLPNPPTSCAGISTALRLTQGLIAKYIEKPTANQLHKRLYQQGQVE
eukprot:5754140-Pyramimonas_sp.AAC.2